MLRPKLETVLAPVSYRSSRRRRQRKRLLPKVPNVNYRELLLWWSEFRDHFFEEKYWLSIIWNNKNFRINEKPVFYKTYYNSVICTVNDLLFNINNVNSFDIIKTKKINRPIFSHGLVLDTQYRLTLKQPTIGLIDTFPILSVTVIFLIFQKRNRKTFIH